MKVGICTGGGDCPGLNAVIRAAVKHAIGTYGWEIWGIRDSFNGFMSRPYDVWRLDMNSVSDILTRGGTILGTTNQGNPFKLNENGQACDKSKLVIEAYKDLKFDAVICIGGDGTQAIAYQLMQLGMNMVGIPKTIDNDLAATDLTVGFDTAVDIATDATERLQSTAESHDRAMVLEVMGRDAGHIALHAGIAGGANVILIPEIPFDYDAIIHKLAERKKLGRAYSVIVCAEGAYEKNGQPVFKTHSSGRQNLGGVGEQVSRELHKRLGIETRVTVLGHTQRGGTPSASDRVLGSAYGVYAIEMVKRKAFGKIVAFHKGEFVETEYEDVAGKYRPISSTDPYLKTAEAIGINLGRHSDFKAID